MKKIKIIGAGMSGLLCAYYAVKKGYQVEVFEAQSESGGKIRTLLSKHGLMETAANALLADVEVESVAREISLPLIAKKPEANNRYIYVNQKIQRWPLGFKSTVSLFKFIFLWKFFTKKVVPVQNETLESWSNRVMTPQITHNLLEPACLGIFGEISKKLSAQLIFNYFFSKKKKKLGKLRGSVAPEKGMGQWAEFLVKYLTEKNVKFSFNKDVKINDEITIVATDLKNAVNLLAEKQDPRAVLLEKIPQVDLLSVNVFFAKRPLLQKPGFGVLFARQEQVIPLGVLLNSDIFLHRAENVHSETWIFGSSESQDIHKDEDYFLQNIRATRQKLWNTDEDPLEVRINRWPQAIPLYGTELEKTLRQVQVSLGTIHLMGNYLGEIGLNRLFHRAKSLIDQL